MNMVPSVVNSPPLMPYHSGGRRIPKPDIPRVAMNLTGDDRPERVTKARVSPSLFRVLDADAALGIVLAKGES